MHNLYHLSVIGTSPQRGHFNVLRLAPEPPALHSAGLGKCKGRFSGQSSKAERLEQTGAASAVPVRTCMGSHTTGPQPHVGNLSPSTTRQWDASQYAVSKKPMSDLRYTKLAKLIVGYSIAVRKGDNVLIEITDAPDEFAIALMRAVRAAGARAFIEVRHSRLNREILRQADGQAARLIRDVELARMKRMQAYVAVRGANNITETSDVPADRLAQYTRITRPVLDWRVRKTRWCVLRWPTPSMAQAAGMSTEAFEDFFFEVCTLDYRRMARAIEPLHRRMLRADQVRIKGPGTDLTFSIKGIGAVPCVGLRNLPDGEVYSCPVKNSVNGVIQFNAPTVYAGTKFENIRLEFESGKIVKATGSDTKRLNQILDTDPGARYLGEFSLGLNPHILRPMCDILFDEKIAGSLHLTPGRAYDECDNGNRSAIHWDMVLIQRRDWGGGEVWFDNELIRKDGLFVPKDLQGLNPANLR